LRRPLLRVLLGGRLLRRGGLPGGLLRGLLARRRALRPLLDEQLEGPLLGHALRVVTAPQRRVRLPVGDVGTEAPVLDDDLLAADRVLTELLERRLGGPAPPLGLGVQRERLLE